MADGQENLLENGDFSELCGSVPDEWYGFGWCSVAIAEEPHLEFEGRKPCRAFKRSYTYSGMAQAVQYVVETGHRYKFSANTRLGPDTQAGHKDVIKCTMKLKLSNSADYQYIRAGEAGDVTSSGWSKMNGRLNMPKVGSDVMLEEATIYFEGPEKEIDFLVADVRLWDNTPGAAKRPPSAAMSKMAVSKSPTKDVFISYQWGIQDKIKELKEKIESAGLSCWMDIGNMGGGDALYTEIDKGLRGAKVVISCVTEKYAQSENCQREVALADLLKKPLIPVLFEKVEWPPAGPMAMIFAKLIFINMYRGPGVVPPEKFDELLSKIPK